MRIDVIHLSRLQQRGDGRPGPAAAMAAREERVFSCDSLGPDRPLDGVGVDLDAASLRKSLKSAAPGYAIADRLEFAFTCNPRRDLALRYADGSAPAPVAPTAQSGKSNNRSELRTG